MSARIPLFILLCFLLAACGGRSPATRYYVLQGDIAAPGASKTPGSREVSLYKVDIPAYLDRNSIVTRQDDGVRLGVAEYRQWAEPVDRGVRRVLGETLAPAMADNGAVLLSANDNPHGAGIRLYVDIQRLDGALNGDVELTASFAVRDRDERILGRGFFAEKEAAGQDYESMVAAESRLLVKFGQVMASRITEILGAGQKHEKSIDSRAGRAGKSR